MNVITRLHAGGVHEQVLVPVGGGLSVEVRYERVPSGWSARFTLRDPAVDDLEIVHRLVAPTLGEARRAVPAAVAFLLGLPAAVDEAGG